MNDTTTLTLDDIERLFNERGDSAYSGEPVSQLEHALQSAQLAEQSEASDSLVVAALLHDIGHLLNDLGETPTLRGVDDRHEVVAIPRLRGLFNEAVLAPILLHVDAKRYLCVRGHAGRTGAAYRQTLSPDSLRSLTLQGGPFSAVEAEDYLSRPFAIDAVKLRLWDDAAKTPGLATPPLTHYLELAALVSARHQQRLG